MAVTPTLLTAMAHDAWPPQPQCQQQLLAPLAITTWPPPMATSTPSSTWQRRQLVSLGPAYQCHEQVSSFISFISNDYHYQFCDPSISMTTFPASKFFYFFILCTSSVMSHNDDPAPLSSSPIRSTPTCPVSSQHHPMTVSSHHHRPQPPDDDHDIVSNTPQRWRQQLPNDSGWSCPRAHLHSSLVYFVLFSRLNVYFLSLLLQNWELVVVAK